MRYILVGVIAVVLASCATQSSSASAPVETAQVTMPPSYRFDPVDIQVPAGTTVQWHNADNFTHGVQVLDSDLPVVTIPVGQDGSMTFSQPGTYTYVCPYHAQNMKGKVVVVGRS